MEVEFLHIHHGDKKKVVDTTKPEGRNEVDKLFKNLCEQKCAVFLERGKETFRVVGYDAAKDQFIVETGRGKRKKRESTSIAGMKATCRVAGSTAKLAAVAPVAGGSQ